MRKNIYLNFFLLFLAMLVPGKKCEIKRTLGTIERLWKQGSRRSKKRGRDGNGHGTKTLNFTVNLSFLTRHCYRDASF